MFTRSTRLRLLPVPLLLALFWTPAQAQHLWFEPGDVIVSLEQGPVQWWLADGTPRGVLMQRVVGTGEGMAWDLAGNLYVTRWCIDPMCMTGNTVEKFNPMGVSLGTVGAGYDCGPHTLVFDKMGAAYVGLAGCRRSILKFMPGQVEPIELLAETENAGIFWLDLAADGCTLFYTSWGPNVKRFDACAGVQLANFNAGPLPGLDTQDLRVLPDGGVLVSNGQVITRLDASGAVVRTYQGPPEETLWAGLDLVGDGTFWVANYYSSNVYRFDLASGTIVDTFNTGTPPNSAVAVRVKR
ncbi:MAG TPA: hypothetical protein VIX63_14290 [Vicinamibacterales bacterium]